MESGGYQPVPGYCASHMWRVLSNLLTRLRRIATITSVANYPAMMFFVCLKTRAGTCGLASRATCVSLSLAGTAPPNPFILTLKRTDCPRLTCRRPIAKTLTVIFGWDFTMADSRAIEMDTFDSSRMPTDYRPGSFARCISIMPGVCGPQLVRAESFVSTIRKRNIQALLFTRPRMDWPATASRALRKTNQDGCISARRAV